MRHTHSLSQLPNALIYTSDTDAVTIMREYLSRYGCQVFVNTSEAIDAQYCFIVGTADFVTELIEKHAAYPEKSLVIVWSYDSLPLSFQFHWKGKIAIVSPSLWNQKTIEDIFRFLIISKEKYLVAGLEGKPAFIDYPKNITQPQYNQTAQNTADISPVAANEDVHPKIHIRQHPTLSPKNISDDYDQDRVAKTIASVYTKKIVTPSFQTKKKSLWKPFRIASGLVLICVAIFIPYIVVGLQSLTILDCAKSSDLSCFVRLSKPYRTTVSVALSYDQATSSVLRVFYPGYHSPFYPYLTVSFQVSSIMEEAPTLLDSAHALSRGIITPLSNTPVLSLSQKLLAQIRMVNKQLGVIQNSLDSIVNNNKNILGMIDSGNIRIRAQKEVATTIDLASQAEKFLSIYPDLGGFRNPKLYIVLLQNSAELRPTGGFIGSIMLLRVDGGVLTEKIVHDVYTMDGQLRGHVTPPDPIKNLLGQEHWYLRDSNWDPDFPASAKKAIWFYEKETGDSVDGVIALNSEVIRKYLQFTGPIHLQDIGETISSDDFYEKAYGLTEQGFFPGSTKKRDFLGSLSMHILSSFDQTNKNNSIELLRVIMDSIISGDIAIYSSDEQIQKRITTFGWSGNIPRFTNCLGVPLSTFSCTTIPVHINESNMSVSKMSPFIDRTQSREIIIEANGVITEHITRTMTNTKEPGAVGMDYTTYLQFIVHNDSVIQSINIDGMPIPKKEISTAQPLPYWEFTQEENRGNIGIATIIKAGSSQTIHASITHLQPVAFGKNGAFIEVITQRQSGTGDIPSSTVIRYPHDWKASSALINPLGSLAIRGQLEYNSGLSRDETMYLILGKKP